MCVTVFFPLKRLLDTGFSYFLHKYLSLRDTGTGSCHNQSITSSYRSALLSLCLAPGFGRSPPVACRNQRPPLTADGGCVLHQVFEHYIVYRIGNLHHSWALPISGAKEQNNSRRNKHLSYFCLMTERENSGHQKPSLESI